MSAAESTGVNISHLADGIFFGIILSTALWGITIVQTWTYINNNLDKWLIRSLVVFLFVLDTATTAFTTEMAHHYLIQNFGNLTALGLLPNSVFAEVTINVVVVFMVECFFAHRVFLLSGRKLLLPAIIMFFALAALVAGMSDIARVGTVAHLASTSMKWEVALTNACYAASDVVSTISMSWLFHKGKGGIKKTNTLLERLLIYTVARGGMVSVSQLLTLILYVAQPTSLNWMPIHFCLCKLYVITMVVILNSRPNLRAQLYSHGGASFTESVTGPPPRSLVRSNPQASNNAFQLASFQRPGLQPDSKTHPEGITITQERVVDYGDVKVESA